MSEGHQSGTIIGYKAEYRKDENSPWKVIEMRRQYCRNGDIVTGIPGPMIHGNLLSECFLMGKEQALAAAYLFAADAAAVTLFSPEVRIVPYTVKYSLEWKQKE